jgi:hypothetical protein
MIVSLRARRCHNLRDMSWLEQRIRRYEHRRWTTDDNRRVRPFEWGLEHLGGRRDDPDPHAFLNAWVPDTLADSEEWFQTDPADDYVLHPSEARAETRAENGAKNGAPTAFSPSPAG